MQRKTKLVAIVDDIPCAAHCRASLGGGMDDATFLKQCGIEVDMRWLAEITSQKEPTEVSNYATSLLRIADILTQTP
jgi:hypothetical protein